MSPSAVPHVARRGRQSDTEIVATATGAHAKCFLQYAPSVAKRPKYHLNLAVISRCIVAIATVKSDRVDNACLTIGHTWAGDTWPMHVSRMWCCVMLIEVPIREGESQDSLLCRFRRMVQIICSCSAWVFSLLARPLAKGYEIK